jgi:hypothetical protein
MDKLTLLDMFKHGTATWSAVSFSSLCFFGVLAVGWHLWRLLIIKTQQMEKRNRKANYSNCDRRFDGRNFSIYSNIKTL